MNAQTDHETKISPAEILSHQLFLTRLCFRRAPFAMGLHLFEAAKLQVSIFCESILAVNYCLGVAERGESWQKILWCMLLLMGAIALSTCTFAYYKHSVMPRALPLLHQELRMLVYEKSAALDLSSYDNPEFYQEFMLASAETDQCIDRYLATLDRVTGLTVQIALNLLYCALINPPALLLPLVTFPLGLFLSALETRVIVKARLTRMDLERRRDYAQRVFYLADYAKELRLNRSTQERYKKEFRQRNKEIAGVNGSFGRKAFLCGFLNQGILQNVAANGLLWSLLLYQCLVSRTLSLAHLYTSYRSANSFSRYGAELAAEYQGLVENSVYLRKIRRMLEMEPSIVSQKKLPVPEVPSVLSLEHVSFSYPQASSSLSDRPASSGHEVLRDISMEIQPRQKIALVGYNGSGKTTLVKLLLRLYDPTGGKILCRGQNIRDYDVTAYRRSIGVVFQDFKIYAATLKENVLMDLPTGEADEDYRVEKALYDARFTLDDTRLVYQIDTPLTAEFEKAGVDLSGGEAQKVAIARTLYRDQNLIIMDEPSSALDPMAEYQLNAALNEIAKEKTVIFISHRLSATRDADRIYMMSQGQIIESGTHQELLSAGGEYAKMWRVQASKY